MGFHGTSQARRTGKTIRIPLREERVDINKIIYNLEQADIYKKQIQQKEAINAVLKKEVMVLKTSGQVDLETRWNAIMSNLPCHCGGVSIRIHKSSKNNQEVK